jgi:hypothetical protein
LAIVIVDGLLFGVLPAWRSSLANPQDAMRSDSRTSTSGRDSIRLRSLLVSAEVGLCAISLLVGGLLLQSFSRVLNVQRGFDVNGIQTVTITCRPPGIRFPARSSCGIRERIHQVRGGEPGVSTMPPLAGAALL